MDRSKLEQRLLANASRRATVPVELTSMGETVHLFTTLTNEEQLRVMTAGGDEGDEAARQLVAIVRFAVADEDGRPLLKSFAEAAGFLNLLDVQDLATMLETLEKLALATPTDGAEVVEVGKA